MKPLGVYIHIPFCVRKCSYCDFVSYPQQDGDVQQYFRTLDQEVGWYVQDALFSEYEPVTLYVGGGTPSLVTEELVAFIHSHQAILVPKYLREMTIEVNPGTITFPQFQTLRRAGFNRVSIGVQSLHDTELKCLGRIHTREEAVACVHAARRAGFENVNIDLIFGIPSSDLTTWKTTLTQAVALKPEHVSLYNLTIEEGTPFWKQQQHGKLLLPDEDLQIEMYEIGIDTFTEAGYEHYEISNFALPGYRSQHNQIYWKNEEYLGLGAGAHSYLKGRRYWNHTGLETYTTHHMSKQKVSHISHSPPTVEGEECLDLIGTRGETVMMNLRLIEGIDLTAFQDRFGQSLRTVYADTIKKLSDLKLVEINNHHFRLTPKGILLSNEVFQEFMSVNSSCCNEVMTHDI